jgi:hypothetical protein
MIAPQEVTLNGVGDLTGYFEEAPLLVTMKSRLAGGGVGSYRDLVLTA